MDNPSCLQTPEVLIFGVWGSVSETRCNGGAFRDRSSHPWPLLVWPSLAKQLPPGLTIAPLTLQQHRHGSETPPGPFGEARIVGAGPAREREQRSRQDPRDLVCAALREVSGILPAGKAGLPLARQAPTKPASCHRLAARCQGRFGLGARCPGLCEAGNRSGPPLRQAPRDGFTAFPEGPNTDPRPRMEGP